MKVKELLRAAEGIGIAVILESNDLGEAIWSVHLLNFNDFPLESILVNSQGYGEQDGEEIKTSQLRHFIEGVAANAHTKIEMITPEVFGLNNQYWVSYYVNGKIYDKKFIFEAHSIQEENLQTIDDLNARGIIKL